MRCRGDTDPSIPVFPGAPDARSYNATPWLSAWWLPAERTASNISVTLRYTGGYPAWFSFGPSPGRAMIYTDAWVVKVFTGPGTIPIVANVTDMRLLVKSSNTGPGTIDASQDVSLSYAAWFSSVDDPGAAVYGSSLSLPVFYAVLTRAMMTADADDSDFNATSSVLSSVALGHSLRVGGKYGIGSHGAVTGVSKGNATIASLDLFLGDLSVSSSQTVSSSASPTITPSVSESGSVSVSVSSSASLSASITASLSTARSPSISESMLLSASATTTSTFVAGLSMSKTATTTNTIRSSATVSVSVSAGAPALSKSSSVSVSSSIRAASKTSSRSSSPRSTALASRSASVSVAASLSVLSSPSLSSSASASATPLPVCGQPPILNAVVGPVSITWQVPLTSDSSITIRFDFPVATGWFGFGIRHSSAEGMLLSDTWTMRMDDNGQPELLDGMAREMNNDFGRGLEPNAIPSVTCIDCGIDPISGGLAFTVRRELSVGGPDENNFTLYGSGSTPVAAAWSADTNVVGFHDQNYEVAEIDFFPIAVSGCPSATPYPFQSLSSPPSPQTLLPPLSQTVSRSPSGNPTRTQTTTPTRIALINNTLAIAGIIRNVTVNSVISMSWGVPSPEDDSITITFRFGLPGGWLGFGLPSSPGQMIGSDMWLMSVVNGRGQLTDAYATQHARPLPDASQDCILVASGLSSDAQSFIFVVRRKLVVADSTDATITQGLPSDVLFAWGGGAIGYHASNRLASSLDFFDASTTALDYSDTTAVAAKTKKYAFHALSNGITFLLLMPISIAAIRFFPHSKIAVNFHRFSMLNAVSLTLPAVGQALASSSGAGATVPLINSHMQCGFTISFILIAQIIVGLITSSYLRSHSLPPPHFPALKMFHKYTGYAEMFLAIINCFFGFELLLGDLAASYNALLRSVLVMYVLTLASVFIALTMYDLRTKQGKVCCLSCTRSSARAATAVISEEISESLSRSMNALSLSQLREMIGSGRKLVIYKRCIIDVSTFINQHPGGSYALSAFLGEDVSTMFDGQNSLSGAPHVHSKRAQQILSSCLIGALKREDAGFLWEEDLQDDLRSWVLCDKSEASAGSEPVVRFEFRLLGQGLGEPRRVERAPRTWNYASFGRHVIVRAEVDAATLLAAAKRRNSLALYSPGYPSSPSSSRGEKQLSPMSPSRLVARKSFNSSKNRASSKVAPLKPSNNSIERSYTITRTADAGSIVLFIKLYEDGLMSQALKKMVVGERLQMSPSKGLGFQLDSSSSGEILFISQGTGLLAGMDLISHIADTHFSDWRDSLGTGDSASTEARTVTDSSGSARQLSVSVIACFESHAHAIHRNHFDRLHERCPPIRIRWNFKLHAEELSVVAPSETLPPPAVAVGDAAPADGAAPKPPFGWIADIQYLPPLRARPLVSYGYLDAATFNQAFPKKNFLTVAVCGRPLFVESVRTLAQSQGVPASSIIAI